MRIYLGGLWHETHTFAASRTNLLDFEAHKLLKGDAIVETFASTSTEIGGALPVLAEAGVTPVPGLFAGAMPSGPIEPQAWHKLSQQIVDGIRYTRPDGIFLSLHGAMVVPGVDDAEGTLLSRVRQIAGQHIPIAVTLDCHANTSPQLVEAVDIVVAYDTYPHTDFAERGAEAARLLLRILAGETFHRALVQLPIVPPVPAQASAESPMRELWALAHALEALPQNEAISWMPGFPYSDVPRMGMSATLIHSGEITTLEETARLLARSAWSVRERFQVDLASVEEAVRAADQAPEGPVVLVDVADNVGGGSPGDGTAILAELVARRVGRSVVSIADAESVRAAVAAGVGSRVRLMVGGKVDHWHGEPVPFEGVVRWAGDGTFTLKGSWMRGLVVRPGLAAWVSNDDGVSIVLSERKVPPFDAGEIGRVGIDPATCRVIVAKSAIAWQAGYGSVAKQAIYVDTPGICTPHLARLPYQKRRRPLLPFDPEASWQDVQIHVLVGRENQGHLGQKA